MDLHSNSNVNTEKKMKRCPRKIRILESKRERKENHASHLDYELLVIITGCIHNKNKNVSVTVDIII